MPKNAIFLSGYEYNRILADNVFASPLSALPNQVLWDGSAQFWLFEKVYCSKESLDGELAAAEELGWTTGSIFADLKRRGFLEPVCIRDLVVDDPQLGAELTAAWSTQRSSHAKQLLRILEAGHDGQLEDIKLKLLLPLLRHLNCLQNMSPNSIRHWMPGYEPSKDESESAQALDALAQPLARQRILLRGGFTLCRPPGTGVSAEAVRKQKKVEQLIEKPMIPRLLAGLLNPADYYSALKPVASVYKPINVQLKSDYDTNVDRLDRLRDAAKKHLWADLHGEWLPRLDEDPSFPLEFGRLIRDALLRSALDPYLKWTTDIGILLVSVGIGLGTVIATANAGPAVSGAAGTAAGGGAAKLLTGIHEELRRKTDALTLFYQKARRSLRPKREVK